MLVILSLLITSLQTFHPLSLAINLILTCFFIGGLLIKITISWLFYLLILIFLGGIIIVVIYIASLAANEKLPPIIIPPQRNFLLVLSFFLFIFDFGNFYKTSSSFSFAGDPYGLFFAPILIFCFGLLFLAIVRATNLIKLEEGPLVKRL